MRILITGGAGFIGSHLADHFLRNGQEVLVFDNLFREGVKKNLEWLEQSHGKKLNFIKGNIIDFDSLAKSCKDVDAILHTAAQTAVTTSITNPREDFEINALGSFNVLEAARQSNSNPIIIYTSTNKVYGNNVNAIPLTEKETRHEFGGEKYAHGVPEDFPTDASEHTPYGSSKYSADVYVRDYNTLYGLKTVVFRMSCIYGTRQFGNEDQGWVAHFIISSVFNKPLTVFGDGKQVRDILFVDDLVKAFDLASQNISKTEGQVYNIGGGPKNTISLLELFDILKRFNLSTKHTFSDWRAADQKVYVSDIRKAKAFGWAPTVSPEEGIRKLLEWVKENKSLF